MSNRYKREKWEPQGIKVPQNLRDAADAGFKFYQLFGEAKQVID
jgi:hypothetical protein